MAWEKYTIEAHRDQLQRRYDYLNGQIAQRAYDPAMQNVPGGKTGLITTRPGRKDAELSVDIETLTELRSIERRMLELL